MSPYSIARKALAGRLREVRIECFGDDVDGISALAAALSLPPASWRNYENGVAMPSEILLALMELTRVRPHWLATGEGERYARTDPRLRFLPEN